MTWKKLVALEPRLAELAKRMRQHALENSQSPKYCANRHWYHGFKNEMSDIVGYEALNPALKTEAAYDCAYKFLYHLLPDCRGCDGIC